MSRIILKVLVICFVLIIECFLSDVWAQTQANKPASAQIVYLDQARGFVIINMGKDEAVEEGCFLNVYRAKLKIGELKVIKVRKRFSAADIECTYRNRLMQIGDVVKISKKKAALTTQEEKRLIREKRQRLNTLFTQAEGYLKNKHYEQAKNEINEVLKLAPVNKRALAMLEMINQAALREQLKKDLTEARTYFEQRKYQQAQSKAREILEQDPQNVPAQGMLDRIKQVFPEPIKLEPKIVSVDINATKRAIHATTIDVLKKYGYLITFSDPLNYNLEANKYIELPLDKELFTESEWGPFTRNKVYYSIQIKELPESENQFFNRLVISVRETYDKEGRTYYYQTEESLSPYLEAKDMSLEIKSLAEKL